MSSEWFDFFYISFLYALVHIRSTYSGAVEDVLKPPGSLLATDRSKAVVLV